MTQLAVEGDHVNARFPRAENQQVAQIQTERVSLERLWRIPPAVVRSSPMTARGALAGGVGDSQGQETAMAKAERLLAEELRRRKVRPEDWAGRPKGDRPKTRIALRLRAETPITWDWIAEKLAIGRWRPCGPWCSGTQGAERKWGYSGPLHNSCSFVVSERITSLWPGLCALCVLSRRTRVIGLLVFPVPGFEQIRDGVAEAGQQVFAVQIRPGAQQLALDQRVADFDAFRVGIDDPGEAGAAGEEIPQALVVKVGQPKLWFDPLYGSPYPDPGGGRAILHRVIVGRWARRRKEVFSSRRRADGTSVLPGDLGFRGGGWHRAKLGNYLR